MKIQEFSKQMTRKKYCGRTDNKKKKKKKRSPNGRGSGDGIYRIEEAHCCSSQKYSDEETSCYQQNWVNTLDS